MPEFSEKLDLDWEDRITMLLCSPVDCLCIYYEIRDLNRVNYYWNYISGSVNISAHLDAVNFGSFYRCKSYIGSGGIRNK